MWAGTWWREASELDTAQQDVAALPADGKYLVTGKPGSGKTNLLVLRAAYLIRANHPNLKILTWTRLLKEFISSVSESHGLMDDQLQTFKSWSERALAEIGINIVVDGDYEVQINQLIAALRSVCGSLARYDGLLVDESQDYPLAVINLFTELAGRLFFVGDENQRIYASSGALNAIRELVDQEFVLPYHYRNGRRICLVAEGISNERDYATTSRYDEERLPSRVYLRGFGSVERQVEATVVELRAQIRSYPGELLGVMVPHRDERNATIELLRESEIEEYCQFQTRVEGYSGLEEDKPVVVSSVHGAKGLEYRAVHIVGLEGLGRFPAAKQRNIAYTAVTRAKTTLHGYYTGAIPSWLRSAFMRGQDPPSTPTLTDLFAR